MKKYVKPTLYFESFELAQSIASCSDVVSAQDKTCVEEYTGFWGLLNDDGSISGFEDYCWTNGTMPYGNYFGS